MAIKTVNELKSYFETGDRPTEEQFSDLIDSLHHKNGGLIIASKSYNATTGDFSIGFSDNTSISFTVPQNADIDFINGLQDELDDKVDKADGYGLSQNDYSDAEKAKVTAADTHVADSTLHVSASDRSNWDGKQDAEADKGLSANDYSDAEKAKVTAGAAHVADDTLHVSANKDYIWSDKLKPYQANEEFSLNTGGTLRVLNNNVYKLTTDNENYPFTSVDFDTELAAGDWELVLSAASATVVRITNQDEILNQVLDSEKLYELEIDIVNDDPTKSIIVPAGGLTIRGFGFNNTAIVAQAGCTAFTSPVGGSGDIIIQDVSLTASGTGAKVFDLTDADGSHAVEIERVNFSGCVSLGEINGYRQGTATTTGIYGCSDGLILSGAWNGFKVSNTNCFGFGAAGTLFKKAVDTVFSNRFFVNVNVDLPTGAVLCDFQASNFAENELFQINSSIAKLNGVLDISNGELLIPNLSANSLESLWIGNIGLPDTATEVFIEDATVTGAYVIDWLKDTYFLTMTGDTTFTESNIPASGKNTQEIKIYLTGDFEPTFPADWSTNQVGTYKGSDVNEITIKFIKTGIYFVKIANTLTPYPAPILGSVNPISLLPSSTSELTISGSFYTPEGFVLIDGQVVNTIEFKPDTGDYVLSVTTGALEGEFDITISNGTSVTFNNKLIVNLGDVFIPTAADWNVLTGSPDLTEDGAVKLTTFDSLCEAVYTTELDISGDFEVRHNLLRSNLSTDETPAFQSIQLIDAVTDAVMFYLEYTMGNGDGGHAQTRTASAADSPDFHLWFYPKTITEKFEYFATAKNYFRYVSGVMYYYENDVLIRTFTDTLSNNLKIKVRTQKANVNNIKYIELP